MIVKELDRQNLPLVVLAIGQFDGVHLGHQSVLRRSITVAHELQGRSGVLSFKPHPIRVLYPERSFQMLSPEEENARMILSFGVDSCETMPFTHAFAQLPPSQFLQELRRNFPYLRAIVTGWNFTFGRDAEGNTRSLPQMAVAAGLRVYIMPPVLFEGQPVSSTRIRNAVREGNLSLAASLLGRPYAVTGEVVHGRHVGQRIGFPTANVQMPANVLRPAPGVYTASFQHDMDDTPLPAMAFVPDPTDPSQKQFADGAVEVHVNNLNEDLYGQDVRILLHRRIRGHRSFNTLEDLAAQLRRDMAVVDALEEPPEEIGQTREPRLWLFDMDGTLLDTLGDLTISVNLMRAQYGLLPLPKQVVKNYIGDGLRQLAIRSLEGLEADEDIVFQQVIGFYAEHLSDVTEVLPEVDATLRKLRELNPADKMGVVTNKPHEHAVRLIEHFKWADLFDVVIGGGDTELLKPNPDPILEAIQQAGISKEQTWMIGDSSTDLKAARLAGVKSIFLECGFGRANDEKPTLSFQRFSQLLAAAK